MLELRPRTESFPAPERDYGAIENSAAVKRNASAAPSAVKESWGPAADDRRRTLSLFADDPQPTPTAPAGRGSRASQSSPSSPAAARSRALSPRGGAVSSSSYRAAVPHPTRSFTPAAVSAVALPHAERYRHALLVVADHHRAQSAAAPSAAAARPCCAGEGTFGGREVEDVLLRDEWQRLLDSANASAEAAHSARIATRALVWRGIPPSLRVSAWLLLLRDRLPSADMDAYMAATWRQVEAEQSRAAAWASQQPQPTPAFPASASPLWSAFSDIEKDVGRTLPGQWLFRTAAGVASLRRVLLCFAVHCPLVGYCQGLNFIAGSLLVAAAGDEVSAFALLCAVVSGRCGYYTRSMAGCMVDTAVMSDLAAFFEPELLALLGSYGLRVADFCSSWFICLFCNAPLRLSHAMRVWDVLFCLGDEALFRVGLALLRQSHARLLQCGGPEEVLALFLQRMGDVDSIEPVLRHAQRQWMEEPSLAASVDALRDFHRYEVTAEHSRLSASTMSRMQDATGFDERELQRLWELFIQPQPWQTIVTGCISSLVHFRFSFCAAVFHPHTSGQFKGKGLVLSHGPPPPPTQPPHARSHVEAAEGVPASPSAAATPAGCASPSAVERLRLFSASAGASALQPSASADAPSSRRWSATAGASAIEAFYDPTQPEPEEPLTDAAAVAAFRLGADAAAPPLLESHAQRFHVPPAADAGDSIFAAKPKPAQFFSFPTAAPTPPAFAAPSNTVPLPSPLPSPSSKRKRKVKGASHSWLMRSAEPNGPSSASASAAAPSAAPSRPPQLELALPPSFSAHRALRFSASQSVAAGLSANHTRDEAAVTKPPGVAQRLTSTWPLFASSSDLSAPLPAATRSLSSPLQPLPPSPRSGGAPWLSSDGQVNLIARLFAMLDGLGRGCVDFDEFCFGVSIFKKFSRAARLRCVFAMADVRGEGQISMAEFRAFVSMFDALYHGQRSSGARHVDAFVQAAVEKAAPSHFINCPLFEQLAQLHPHIVDFFRL